jgi:hypothetical protein
MEDNNKVRFNFKKLSTKPSKKNTVWLGNRSILATIVLGLIYIFRYFSLLQIVKESYRFIVKKANKYTQDSYATRVNVPPILPELYFLVWLVALIILKCFGVSGLAIKIISGYYLFESFIWITYYSLFRRFFEENYSIYHSLEYFLPLIVIFPTQALGISNIYDVSFSVAILAILGTADESLPSYINVMGIMFGAIVIGLLVSRFPNERIKANDGYPVLIIGNGDVVAVRLFPALTAKHYSDKEIVKCDIEKDDKQKDKNCLYFSSGKEIIDHIDWVGGEKSVIWICCPSSSHVYYLKELVEQDNKLIVCEKPICINKDDLENVCKLNANESARDKIFYLSYYLLEKALPLYYYCTGNRFYLKYLSAPNDLLTVKNFLGKLISVNVNIVEGYDARKLDADGGHLYETFIHNLLLASLFVGTPDNWVECEGGKLNDTITFKANYKDVSIKLLQQKNSDKVVRNIIAEYNNGRIFMDINTGKMTISCNYDSDKDTSFVVAIKEEYRAKYSIQEDLVYRVANDECLSRDVDGLFHQVEVLSWLMNNETIFKDGKNVLSEEGI